MLIMHEETLLRVCELAAEVIYAIFAVVSSVLLLVWKAVWSPYQPCPATTRAASDGLHARVSRVKIIVRPLAALVTS